MEENVYYIQDGELYHYGVLGMKWGVRKNPAKAYSKSLKKKQKLESNYEMKKNISSKNRSDLIDKARSLKKIEDNARELTDKFDKTQKVRDHLSAQDTNRMGWIAKKRHDKAIDDVDQELGKISKAIAKSRETSTKMKDDLKFDKYITESNEASTRRAERKLQKWSKTMESTFSQIDQATINEGKAMFDEYNARKKKDR